MNLEGCSRESKMDLRYPCSYEGCSKAFKRQDRLEIHLRTHTGERPFVCGLPGCGMSYARSQNLSRHIQRVHFMRNKLQERVVCPHCQEEMANSESLKKHVKRYHSSSSQAKCSYESCEEEFPKKQQLVMHRLKHDDHLISAMRCYSCPHEGCDKQFVFPGRLKRHMKVHQGYPCDVDGCGEVLATWSKLRKHRATVHCPTFNCNTCGTVFKTRSNLNQHLKLHAPDFQPVVCTWEGCSRTFLYKKNLRQHIRSFHKGEQVFIKKPKLHPKKPRKKISDVATLFGLDDRCKELKVSRRNWTGLEKKSDSTSNSHGEERTSPCSTLSLTGTELDVLLSSVRDDKKSSTNLDAVEENQREDLCKNSMESLNSSSSTIIPVMPCKSTS